MMLLTDIGSWHIIIGDPLALIGRLQISGHHNRAQKAKYRCDYRDIQQSCQDDPVPVPGPLETGHGAVLGLGQKLTRVVAVRTGDPESSRARSRSLRQRERAASGDPAKTKGAPRPRGARHSRGSLAWLPLSDCEWLVRRQTIRCCATLAGRATRPSPSSVGNAERP